MELLAQRHGVTRQQAAVLTLPVVRSFYVTELSGAPYLDAVCHTHRWFGEGLAVWMSVLKQKQFSVCKNNDTENGSGISAMLPANHIWLFYRTAMRICV